MSDSSPFIEPSIDIPKQQIIDLTPMSRDLTNHLREINPFPNEQRYGKFLRGPIYLSYERAVPYSDQSTLSIPTMASYLDEMKRNIRNKPIGGSMSRITRRDRTMSNSKTGRQVTKGRQSLCEVYS